MYWRLSVAIVLLRLRRPTHVTGRYGLVRLLMIGVTSSCSQVNQRSSISRELIRKQEQKCTNVETTKQIMVQIIAN